MLMLTNATVKAARPGARPRKIFDAGGLYLFVRPTGSKTWRMKYRRAGKEKLLTFGDYPELGLAEARERRDRAREQLRRGEDPAAHSPKGDNPAATFEAAARAWHQLQLARWSQVHAGDVLASLERDVFPAIGAKRLEEIEAREVLALLRAVERRGAIETARRLRTRIAAIFAFARAEGLGAVSTAADVAVALAPRPPRRAQPALTTIEGARQLLAAAEVFRSAGKNVRLAHRFLALTAVRLATLRGARWSEIEDLDGPAPLWRIPAARMKLSRARKEDAAAEHLVPLSTAAVAVLREARGLTGGDGLIFPGRSGDAPIGETAIGALVIAAGFAGRHVPHGWRATFSTIMNEAEPALRAVIDQALGHVPRDKVESAYNRAAHLDRRRLVFEKWANILSGTAAVDAR
jgi:integrase